MLQQSLQPQVTVELERIKPNVQHRKKRKVKRTKIFLLENSIYYFLVYAIIIIEKDYYRLIVNRNGGNTIDLTSKTLRGAKKAFSHFCNHMRFSEEVRPIWRGPYPPFKYWLKDRIIGKPLNLFAK